MDKRITKKWTVKHYEDGVLVRKETIIEYKKPEKKHSGTFTGTASSSSVNWNPKGQQINWTWEDEDSESR